MLEKRLTKEMKEKQKTKKSKSPIKKKSRITDQGLPTHEFLELPLYPYEYLENKEFPKKEKKETSFEVNFYI